MIFSMTGYAKVTENVAGAEHTFEVKTLNHKYIDIKLNLSRNIDALEPYVTELLRNEIPRGSVRASYMIKNGNASLGKSKFFEIDLDAAKAYHDAYLKVAKILNVNYVADVENIMHHSGVLNIVETEIAEDREQIAKVVQKALAELNKFRIGEGKKLAKFIEQRLKTLKTLILKAAKFAKDVKKIYFDRIKERIEQFTKSAKLDITIAEDRLYQEIAVMADRSDVSEEIERFQTHIKHFEALLKADAKDPVVGRKMDFLCQELFREVTTLSNKTNLIDITKLTIEIKSEVEKIREQVQNIQ